MDASQALPSDEEVHRAKEGTVNEATRVRRRVRRQKQREKKKRLSREEHGLKGTRPAVSVSPAPSSDSSSREGRRDEMQARMEEFQPQAEAVALQVEHIFLPLRDGDRAPEEKREDGRLRHLTDLSVGQLDVLARFLQARLGEVHTAREAARQTRIQLKEEQEHALLEEIHAVALAQAQP